MRLHVLLWSCLLAGCSRHGLWVDHYPISQQSLPSTFARSPDPLQEGDYEGEMVWVSYNLPIREWQKQPQLSVSFLWENLEEETQQIGLEHPSGRIQFSWINEEFQKRGSLLGYRVEAGLFERESPLFRKLIHIDGKHVGTKVSPTSQSRRKDR